MTLFVGTFSNEKIGKPDVPSSSYIIVVGWALQCKFKWDSFECQFHLSVSETGILTLVDSGNIQTSC